MKSSAAPVLVLDVETQQTFAEVGGKQNLHRLKIAVVCVYNYATEQYLSFTEKDMIELEELLRTANLIVGFNVRQFDFGVLKPYLFTPIEQFPIFDILEDIEKVRGHRVSLQSVADATFGEKKTGDGLEAVRLFRAGRMQELISYCKHDVQLTKKVYDYGREHDKVLFRSVKDFRVHEIPVMWKNTIPKEKPVASAFPASLF